MKKALSATMLLALLVGWVPLSMALASTVVGHQQAQENHPCCPHPQPRLEIQLPVLPMRCGSGHRCCFASEKPATLPTATQGSRVSTELVATRNSQSDPAMTSGRIPLVHHFPSPQLYPD